MFPNPYFIITFIYHSLDVSVFLFNVLVTFKLEMNSLHFLVNAKLNTVQTSSVLYRKALSYTVCLSDVQYVSVMYSMSQ